MGFLEEICFYQTRSRNKIFVIVKTNVFGIDGGRLVLGFFTFRACSDCFLQRPPYFRFGKIVIFSKQSIDTNSVFFKTLSKSIYTSNMIKSGGQGGLKRKNY